jgi:hypothetical protein
MILHQHNESRGHEYAKANPMSMGVAASHTHMEHHIANYGSKTSRTRAEFRAGKLAQGSVYHEHRSGHEPAAG